MGFRLRRSHPIAPSVRFRARRSTNPSASFGRRKLTFTADPGAGMSEGAASVRFRHPEPMPRTPIRRGHSAAGGLLFALFVTGMLLAAVAFSAA